MAKKSRKSKSQPEIASSVPAVYEFSETDKFFAKVYYRLIKNYDESVYSYTMFFDEIFDRFSTLLGLKTKDFYYKKREEARRSKSKKRNLAFEYDYVSVKEFMTKKNFEQFLSILEKSVPYVKEPFTINDNIKTFSDLLDLTKEEMLFLQYSLAFSRCKYEHRKIMEMADNLRPKISDVYSIMLGIDKEKMENIFKNSILIKFNILIKDDEQKFFYVDKKFSDILITPNLDMDHIENTLFPSELTTELTIDHYDQQKEEIALIEKIINASHESGKKGTNIMFYGAPGTGKTELATVLAKKNGWRIKSVGDINEGDDEEKGRIDRLLNLKLAAKIYSNKKTKAVLLFDEMEDIFKLDLSASFSKAFINRIIEKTSVPIIWTCNEIFMMDRSVLRRMTMNIQFDTPSIKTRRKIWEYESARHGLEYSPDAIDHLSRKYDIVPSVIHTAAEIAKTNNLDKDKVGNVIENIDTLMSYGYKRRFDQHNDLINKDFYNVDFINSTEQDVKVLTEKLLGCKPNFNICLYGPPGTGKSAYGRYLAGQLGKPVLFKRASDLIDMYVGETEKNIAKAFREASHGEMLLIIDEADTFLRSRALASRSWEVSQVNEMLTQMESHNQPFVCTTNLMGDKDAGDLDEASLRRFTFKLKFDFLDKNKIGDIFRTYFKNDPPEFLYDNTLLTPGDFFTVLKKSDILGINDPEKLAKMLEEETQVKPQHQKRKIGF